MNNFQLQELLEGYPVTICAADQIKRQNGRFVIANTDTSLGPGEHWVTFYFPKRGPDEFFDSLGNAPIDYEAGFERALTKPYWMICNRLQDSNSNTCGLYCLYYVMERYGGRTMEDIVKPFLIHTLKKNDNFVKEYVINNT